MLMNFLINALARVRDEEEGQTVVEYSLILVLISIVSIAVMQVVGLNVLGVFGQVRDALA